MMVVLSGLLAASLAIGLPVGSAYADEPTDGTGAGTSATEVLDSLEVKGRARNRIDKRTQFGKAWADVDHNGCDTRNDILNRDLTGVRHKWRTHNCVVKSGNCMIHTLARTSSSRRARRLPPRCRSTMWWR